MSKLRVIHCSCHYFTYNAYQLRSIYKNVLIFTIACMKKGILTCFTYFKSLVITNHFIALLAKHLMQKFIFILIDVSNFKNLLLTNFIFIFDLIELLFAKWTLIKVFCSPFLDTLETKFMVTALNLSLI